MSSYRRDVAPINKTFDTVNGGLATEESLGMVDKEIRQERLRETEPGGAAESIDTVFPEVAEATARKESEEGDEPTQAAPAERETFEEAVAAERKAQAAQNEALGGPVMPVSLSQAGPQETLDTTGVAGSAPTEAPTESDTEKDTEEDTEEDTESDTSEDTEEAEEPQEAAEASEEPASEDTTEDTESNDEDGLPGGTLATVETAKDYVNEVEGEERDARIEAVLAAEKDGKNRVTLVEWLEDEQSEEE